MLSFNTQASFHPVILINVVNIPTGEDKTGIMIKTSDIIGRGEVQITWLLIE